MPMASTTKVMTAIVVIENAPLDMTVKVPAQAVGIEGSSVYLKKDDIYTVKDLLYALMLASANDAAVALAIKVGGSVENFVSLMNEKARELGLKDTNFTNPHGLHNRDHYTTPYDLAVICSYAMKNEVFRELAAAKSVKIRQLGDNTEKTVRNKNKFIYTFEGATGIKIGYTKNAGRCLCASAKRNGTELICVVLNDGNWFNVAADLLKDCFAKYDALG